MTTVAQMYSFIGRHTNPAVLPTSKFGSQGSYH